MNSSGHLLVYQGAQLFYQKSGEGPQPLLLFHGFGQDQSVFEPWIEALHQQFTFYTFDLYFHGQSSWSGERPLEKTDWKNTIAPFLTRERINGFCVGGFSLGAKLALATLEAFPEKVKHLLLLAPDGLKANGWYTMATYPWIIRKFFKSTILQPARFHTIVKWLAMFHLIDRRLLRFAESQMNSEEKRKRVYYTWVVFRHLKFDSLKITGLLNHHKIPLTLVLGNKDNVIPAKKIVRRLAQLNQKDIKIIDADHHEMISRSLPFIGANTPFSQSPA